MPLDEPRTAIELDEELDGDEFATKNYRFSKIGEPVPIINSDDATTSQFDPQSLPSQPLAVSERFGLLFLAHPQGRGFYVVRTKDVMASAEAIKNKQTAPSVEELSLVDVPIGKVSILALSADHSLLAATISTHLHFFAVSALLHKEQKPSYSVPLDESICIKDLRWAKKDAKAYVILSTNGKLYHGSGQSPLNCVMEGVNSVDWSIKGNYIAVAKKNMVSILSSRFKEKLSFLLSFQSVIGDSDVNQVIKVDSIRWIRPDSLAVGCFHLNDDGEEENYVVQVITSPGRRITDASSKPTVLSFNNIFIDFCSDAVPNPTGPHLFLSYLDIHGLAFVANRNLSRQVELFCWPHHSGKNEVARVEILDDSWTLYIDSQGDGEDNVILGLSVDKASQNENIRFMLGDEEKEVSPCCVIICLTIDGKISVYHFASAAGALTSAERCASSEEDDASQEPMKHELPLISSASGDESRKLTSSTSQSRELSRIEVEKTSAMVTAANMSSLSTNLVIRPQEQTSIEKMGSQTLKVDPKKSLPMVLNAHSNAESLSTSEVVTSKGFFSGKVVGDTSRQSVSNYSPLGSNVEPLHKVLPTTIPSAWNLSQSIARVDASKIPDKVDNSDKSTIRSGGSILKNSTDLKEKTSVTFTSFGQTPLSAQGNRNSLSAYPSSQVPSGSSFASGKAFQSESKKELSAPPSPPLLTHFMQNASKQFGNVEEMAKKLDNLLEGIEGKGGFRDASITSLTKYVTELEEGIWALSDKCRMSKGLLNDKLGEIQVLLEKTVEVLARKIYMEGLFKQTTDRKYWEFWSRKKLSSELELKQRRILELNQELTNKLIELERHFNGLEFNKFRENEGTQRDRRALQNRQGRPRQIQSLHSVHNTITAQLSAAEQLSGCLSKQMAALCIESSGKHDVKKQLFESIGLAYVGDSERSPARDRTSIIPANKEYSIASGTIGFKEQSRRNQSGYAKDSEPQTARRRRDSLDRNWVSFDPPKSTVKRVLKEDYEKGSPNQSLLNINKQYLSSQKKSEAAHSKLSVTSEASLNQYKSKGFGTSAKQLTESPSSLFHATAGFQERGIQLSSTNNSSAWLPPSMSQTRMSQNSELGASRLGDEKTKSSLPLTGTKYSFAASESKFVQQSDTSFHPLPSMSEQLAQQPPTLPFGSTGSLDHSKATTKDQKNTNLVSETLLDFKFSGTPPTSFSSAPKVADKGLFSKNSENPTSLDDGQSASSPVQSALGSQSPSSVSKSSSSTLFFAPPFRSEASMSAKEGVSQSQTSDASAVTLPSTLSSFTSGSSFTSDSSSSIIKSDPSLALYGSKSEVQSKVDNIHSKTNVGAKIQTTASQPAMVVSASDLKLGTSVSSVPTELTNSKSGSEDDVGGSSKNSFGTPVIKAEIPSAAEAISTVAVSSEGINGSLKNDISSSSHEEEMEEEAPEIDQPAEFSFSNFDGFGIGSAQNPTTAKANPFGVAAPNKDSTFATSPFMMSASSGELFRPASFNFQPPQLSQPTTVNFSGGFGSGIPGQVSAASGFGQPANVGAGQQALGSVLGSFGQSRQLGTGLPGSNVGSSFGGGFTSAPSSGGFGSLAAGGGVGGFAAAATGGGGFAAAATGGGGFAAAATGGGGFAAAATGGGGFAAAATGGRGFGAAPVNANAGVGFMSSATGGGFGGFNNHQSQPSSGGFSAFSGGGSGTGTPPTQLIMQMRK